jgi:hypothetical protein
MFRTACLVAALALCAATAPPRISLDLAQGATHSAFKTEAGYQGQLKHNKAYTVEEDYAQECEASRDDGENNPGQKCLFPKARAYDAQDQDLSSNVNVAIRLLDNDMVEVNTNVFHDGKPSPFNNADAPKDASELMNPISKTPAEETCSTYLFEYDVKDSAGNDAEEVTFALVLNDVTPPQIQWPQGGMRPEPTGSAKFSQPKKDIVVEYGSGLFLSGVKGIQCYDNVYKNVQPVVSVTGLPPAMVNTGAQCGTDMKSTHDKTRCAGVSANLMDYAKQSKFTTKLNVVCEDFAGIYGSGGKNNKNTFETTMTFVDTTPPVIKPVTDETHECDRSLGDVQAWEKEVCYDDALPVFWHHKLPGDGYTTLVASKTCSLKTFNAQAKSHVAQGKSHKANKADPNTYDNSCDISYTCTDAAGNAVHSTGRSYYVVDTTPPTLNVDYKNGVSGTDEVSTEAQANTLVHQIASHSDHDKSITMACKSMKVDAKGDCATEMNGAISRWHCLDNDSCTMEDDMTYTGKGDKFDVKGVIFKTMQFSDTCTEAADLTYTAGWIVDASYPAFDATAVGTYKRQYIVTDQSGNSVEADVLITLQDPDAPVIQMLGCAKSSQEGTCVDHVEYSFEGEVYKDYGATCHDYVDGSLSHAVEVSGEVVNLLKPKTYLIRYNCQDLSGNAASPVTRTVIVEDTTAPTIHINGQDENFVEAGFPYTDAGACYSDILDGWCCLNTADNKHAARNGANVDGVGCATNDESKNTGMWKTVAVDGKPAWNSATKSFVNAFAQSLDVQDSASSNTKQPVNGNAAIGGLNGAEETYVITYHATDFNGNKAAQTKRTIYVKDTLPPVITLHTPSGNFTKTGLKTTSDNAQYAAAGYTNPATHSKGDMPEIGADNLGKTIDGKKIKSTFDTKHFGNPHSPIKLMAETSSVNGWLVAAVASAVAGVALLSFSAKSSNQVMVPV